MSPYCHLAMAVIALISRKIIHLMITYGMARPEIWKKVEKTPSIIDPYEKTCADFFVPSKCRSEESEDFLHSGAAASTCTETGSTGI